MKCRLRSRRARGLCSHLRGKPIISKCRERRSNENRSKKRQRLSPAKGSQPRRSQGRLTIQKPCPLSPEPEITNLYWEFEGLFTFTTVVTWIANVDILLACREGRLVSTKPRCKCLSGFIIHHKNNCKSSKASAYMLQLRPDEEASLVQQYQPGHSKAGSRAECSSGSPRVSTS